MNDEQFAVESFKATILYGVLAIASLVAAGIAFGEKTAVVFAIVCAAAAYGSQTFYTFGMFKPGVLAQYAAIGAGVASFLALVL